MASLTITPALVRPLLGSITRPYTLGEAANVGDAVYMKSDGKVWLADADAAASAEILGLIVAVSGYGATAAIANDQVDVCLWGPVAGFSSLTPGARAYASTTAGDLDDTAPAGASGDYLWIAGLALAADVFFVRPFTTDTAAQ